MRMDNELILPGDRVYDVVFGIGTVDKVLDGENRLWVALGNRIEAYDSNGNGRFGVRTLYWHNPFIIAPHKSEAKWELMGRIIESVSNVLRGNNVN